MQIAGAAAHFPHDFKPGLFGHFVVQNQQIGVFFVGFFNGFLAVFGFYHGKAGIGQNFGY